MAQEASAASKPAGASYSHTPQDARLISLIIASMGIKDMEPGVEMMLLEWANRYIHTILSDSLVYASHAHPSSSSNPQINLPDLILAIQSNLSHSLIQQPSKSALLSLASSLNSTPLPPISERFGLRLPPREHCLTNVNFTIVPDELDDEDDEEHEGEAEEGQAGAGAGNDPATTANGSHDVGEEDANSPDVSMQDATATDEQPPPPPDQTTRGVKRSLQEDDEYD